MSQIDVSIIMINYNTYDFSVDAINSIIAYTKNLSYEIILVDNASPDGSGDRLYEKFNNKIIYVKSNDNIGTSKGFNLGLKYAHGKYILWLNTDVLINSNFIYQLYSFMEENRDCGICGGNVIDFNNNPAHSYSNDLLSIKFIKKDLNIFNRIIRRIFKKQVSYEFNYTKRPKKVGVIIGAQMMIRKSIIDEVGGFDEDIFMYAEESEFTYRAVSKTKCLVYSIPNATIKHLEGGSFTKDTRFNERRFYWFMLGTLKCIVKSYGEADGKKFLEIYKKRYQRILLILKLMNEKSRYKEILEKKNIIFKMLDNYPKILNVWR